MKATWHGAVLAESDDTTLVEGHHYFPPESVRMELLSPTATRTTCSWKGTCHYFSATVGGETNPDCAWVYPAPTPEAAHLAGRVAFWKGVEVR